MAGATNRRSDSPTIPVAREAAITPPCETQRPIVSDDTLAAAVYLLYGVGYFTGISALIGVIIAHVKVDETSPVLRSPYGDRHPDFCLVVHLVARPHRQGLPVAHRAQTDRQSWVLAVRIIQPAGARAALGSGS
jgi:hypothetical protein